MCLRICLHLCFVSCTFRSLQENADYLVQEWLDFMEHRGVNSFIAAQKISTDAGAVLVVYLTTGMAWDDPERRAIAGAMLEFCGAGGVKAGWSDVAGSPVLGLVSATR